MFAAALVDLGMMLLSAVLSAGAPSVLMMIVITGAIPALAILTVGAVEGGPRLTRRRHAEHSPSTTDAPGRHPAADATAATR